MDGGDWSLVILINIYLITYQCLTRFGQNINLTNLIPVLHNQSLTTSLTFYTIININLITHQCLTGFGQNINFSNTSPHQSLTTSFDFLDNSRSTNDLLIWVSHGLLTISYGSWLNNWERVNFTYFSFYNNIMG